MNATRIAASALLFSALTAAHAVPVVTSASGANAASIQTSVDAFRSSLGTLNSNIAGSFGSGRREINWDGVPDALSAPNSLPANFFNVNSPRGVVFSTPGSGLQVSANATNPTSAPVEFGNLNPNYPAAFAAFSPQRLFTALGSNITDVNFFVPGSTNAAFVSGFGAVFADVDLANVSSMMFFDPSNVLLGTFFVPAATGSEGLSFLGVRFTDERIGRVRITAGNQVLGATTNDGNGTDLVVMDDFIYSEPVAVTVAIPEPGTYALLLAGLLVTGLATRRARQIAR